MDICPRSLYKGDTFMHNGELVRVVNNPYFYEGQNVEVRVERLIPWAPAVGYADYVSRRLHESEMWGRIPNALPCLNLPVRELITLVSDKGQRAKRDYYVLRGYAMAA